MKANEPEDHSTPSEHDGESVAGSTPPEAAAPQAPSDGGATAADATPTGTASRGRMVFVNTIVGISTLLLIVGIFAVWANRLLFNPDNWANTSTQLLQNENIRSTTANYVVDQIYANVDVSGLIRSGLPAEFKPLAAPAAGALRNAAVQGVDLALQRPRIQSLWAEANRAADQTFVNIVNGKQGTLSVNQGVVSLNLATIVNDVAARLGLPSGLGSKLPANIANLTIFKSNQLKFVQDAGSALQSLATWLMVIVPLLYILAIYLARGRRRRTLMVVGFGWLLAGVVALLGRSILESQVASSLTHDASLQATITSVISITTGLLSEAAGATVFIGALLILAGWFAGPARAASAAREAMAPFLRERPLESYAIAAAIMVVIFIWNPIPATGKPLGMIVFLALAMLGTYVLRAQTQREFPEAQLGATTQRMRARADRMRHRRQESKAGRQPPAPATIPAQLKELADLRDHGALTPAEYQAAKQQLLHT